MHLINTKVRINGNEYGILYKTFRDEPEWILYRGRSRNSARGGHGIGVVRKKLLTVLGSQSYII